MRAPLLVVDCRTGRGGADARPTPIWPLTHDLEILPVINKIDLPAADPPRAKKEIEDIIGIPAMDAPEISAKMGINIRGGARAIS